MHISLRTSVYMGNTVTFDAYDIPRSKTNQSLPLEYFKKRRQERLYKAYLWYIYLQLEFHRPSLPPPIEFLPYFLEEKNTREFQDFCYWMGPISV